MDVQMCHHLIFDSLWMLAVEVLHYKLYNINHKQKTSLIKKIEIAIQNKGLVLKISQKGQHQT